MADLDPAELVEVEQWARGFARIWPESEPRSTSVSAKFACLMAAYDRRGVALAAARERIAELEAGREIEQTMLRNAAARITELERDLADRHRIAAMLGRKLGGK